MAEAQIIVRRTPSKETRIQDRIIWDEGLSITARFSLIAMLSLRKGWDYSVRGMAVMLGLSKDTMGKYIRELETAGYLKRLQENGSKGKFEKSRYILTDTPGCFGEEPCPNFSDGTPPPCPNFSDSEPPCPNFPAPDLPDTEKSPQQIYGIEQQNGKEELTPLPPNGERRKRDEPKTAPDWKPERFADFWRAYPCGKSKQAAIKAWDKLRPDDKLLIEMAKGLKRSMASDDWKRGIGIPYAATWLNNRRWEDEEKALPVPDTPAAVPAPVNWGWD